eukprot:TRINITY_DN31087_c0_g1_i1.p1 TRINITY_DN31087_c0_g1~~TRINITY_DN31087_c0_g1_i1.p1  ORF type:complete len:929 (+),score=102.33 TRINITY_DN31087_c0_g1_i1:323-2788(+)
MTPDESTGLHSWAERLERTANLEPLLQPATLAAEDPSMFWSCVRYGHMKNWCRELQEGRATAWEMRSKVSNKFNCDPEFPGDDDSRHSVAIMSYHEVHSVVRRLPGYRQGTPIQIAGRAEERGRGPMAEHLEMIQRLQQLPESRREEALQQLEKAKHQEDARQARQPPINTALIGQRLCCWSCGNCERENVANKLIQCPHCEGTLCPTPSCIRTHAGLCFKVNQTLSEELTSSGRATHCVVLPVDDRVKPYQRSLPTSEAAATIALKKILGCDDLLEGRPERGFQNGLSDELDGCEQFPQNEIVLIQADWTKALHGQAVEIRDLKSVEGAKLNGHRGVLGQYHKDRDRWEVSLFPDSKSKLFKGLNLQMCDTPGMPPQNTRASTILTPLFNNTTFGDELVKESGVDNRIVFGAEELGVRARGDVWVIRRPAKLSQPPGQLRRFCFADFEQLWGIFQFMHIPGTISAAGTVMRRTEETEQQLGSAMRDILCGDEADDSDDDEERPVLDTWNWLLAEAEEDPEPLLGAVVRVWGLKNATVYNGARGRVQELLDGDKLAVHLGEPHCKTLKLKKTNVWILEKASHAEGENLHDASMVAEVKPETQDGSAHQEPQAETCRPDIVPADVKEPQSSASAEGQDSAAARGYQDTAQQFIEPPWRNEEAVVAPSGDDHVRVQPSPPLLRAPRNHARPVGSQFFCAPCDLCFCQDSVSSRFRHGTTIRETLEELLAGDKRKRDIEMMRIVAYEGRLYSLSNRRLTVYRLLQMAGRCKRVKVEIVEDTADFRKKYTTQCHGDSVRIRDTKEVVGKDVPTTSFRHPAIQRWA